MATEAEAVNKALDLLVSIIEDPDASTGYKLEAAREILKYTL